MGHGPQLRAGRRFRPDHHPEPARPGAKVGLPTQHGLLEPDTILGGATPYCAVYPAAEGHVATTLNAALRSRSARDWQAWGEECGIPLAEVG